LLDNQSTLLGNNIKYSSLINSEPYSITKRIFPKTEYSSSQRESLNSITSEKVSLMTALEQSTFGGEYTLFAGLDECLKFVRDYKFHQTDIDYLRTVLSTYTEQEYFDYLLKLDMNDIKIFAVPEGKYFFSLLLL
ncbi:unnamed protein product, partial [Rotaria sp. Silwood2]